MPLPEPVQEEQPDFSTHPDYHPLFHALVAHGHNQDEATLLLLELWCRNTANNRPQQQPAQQPAVPPQPQLPHNEVQQPGHNEPELPGHPIHPQPLHGPQPLHQQRAQDPGEQVKLQQQVGDPGQGPHPPQPVEPLPLQDFLQPPDDNQDGPEPDKADRCTAQLPPVDLEAESHTMALPSPSTYAIEKFRKFEYVPLWYFMEQGCHAADKDKITNEDVWDVMKTSDNRLTIHTAASNRPNPNALTDDQLSWDQFIDGNHLLCRWLIPVGWPEDYAKVLSSFFWQIENHEDKSFPEGKETLLLYQARARKVWHDELKAGHFFNLAKLNEKKLSTYCKEIEAKHFAALRKAVSPFVIDLTNEDSSSDDEEL